MCVAFAPVMIAGLALGNGAFLGELSIDVSSLEAQAEALRQDGATAIFVAINGKAAGAIAIADPIKAATPAALAALRAANIRTVMLTGDNAVTAKAVQAPPSATRTSDAASTPSPFA